MELSYFKHFRDTCPSVTDMEAVVRMIRDDHWRFHSRGYLVVQRQADEIKARLRMLANENTTDDEPDPF